MATELHKAKLRLREQGSEGAARFASSFAAARTDLDKLTAQTSSALDKLLRDFNRTMRTRLLFIGAGTDALTAALLPGMIGEVSRAIRSLRPLMIDVGRESFEQAFDLGSTVTARGFNRVNVPVSFPAVTPELLTSLTANVQDILSELVTDIGSRIQTIINTTMLNGETIARATNQISNLLKTSTEVRAGLRRRINFAFQGETIMRTEIRRIYSNAQQAASEQIAQTIPDLRKRWITVLSNRVGHVEAENRYAPGGEIGPIKIEETFRVQDFTRIGVSNFLTLGGRIRPRGFTGGQRVVRTDRQFNRRGRIITDQMLFPRDPSADPANVVNCLLPDNEVEGDFLAGLKAWYSGPAYEIKTAGGARLSLTANHPVPTAQGWISAHQIKKGDSLFKNVGQCGFSDQGIGKQNHKKRPALVQDIFNALRAHGTFGAISVGGLDFDGDGRFMDGKIEIVGSDRILLGYIKSSAHEILCEPMLMLPAMSQAPVSGDRTFGSFGNRDVSASSSIPCCATLSLNGFIARFLDRYPVHPLSIGRSTKLDSFLSKQSQNWRSRNPDLFGKSVGRFTSQVALDDVVGIRKYEFRGHVYDFKSTSGLIRCQDVFIGNCTCIVMEVVPELEQAQAEAQGILGT